jgi:hypothetical protein
MKINAKLHACQGASVLLLFLVLFSAGNQASAQKRSGMVFMPKGRVYMLEIFESIERATGLAIHYEHGFADSNWYLISSGQFTMHYKHLLGLMLASRGAEYDISGGTIWIRRKHRRRDLVANSM